jgi:acetoacetate decarboxylase
MERINDMKNVLSPTEVQAMLQKFKPNFTGINALNVTFETTPEFVREVLPPPLEPADSPLVTISIQVTDQYKGMTCLVASRYNGFEGNYGLGYVMNSDTAVIFGRDLWGEPKKLGKTRLTREGDKLTGTVERYGQELIRVEAVAERAKTPPAMTTLECFHFKYSIKPDATGIENVRLVNVTFNSKIQTLEICKVNQVKLTETIMDVYGNIPIVKIVGGTYSQYDTIGSGRYLAEVDAEQFLPYAFSNHDDYRITATRSK